MLQVLRRLYDLRDHPFMYYQALMKKRIRADEDRESPNMKKARVDPEQYISDAAKFNKMVIRKLEKAYEVDPEDDLLARFPSGYSMRLIGKIRKTENEELERASNNSNRTVPHEKNENAGKTSEIDNSVAGLGGVPSAQASKTRTTAGDLGLSPASTAVVVHPLSDAVQELLGAQTHEMSAESPSLWSKLYETIDASEIFWGNGLSGGVVVMKCTSDMVVKMIPNFEDFTEYTTLQHLRRQAPDIPIPEPLGLMTSKQTAYIFMSYIPGPNLESVWAQLPSEQKLSISNQLAGILLRLRQIQIPKDCTFGGVGGEGCKDSRRHTRISQKPIRSLADFEDFIFSNPLFGGSVYIRLLRSMSQSHPSTIVFSHGDLRPANIVVLPDRHGNYNISGIVDWEMSGFYPDYWESVKATNTMAPQEEDDWYLHLPACASPTTYPLHWLLDRKWDVHVA